MKDGPTSSGEFIASSRNKVQLGTNLNSGMTNSLMGMHKIACNGNSDLNLNQHLALGLSTERCAEHELELNRNNSKLMQQRLNVNSYDSKQSGDVKDKGEASMFAHPQITQRFEITNIMSSTDMAN